MQSRLKIDRIWIMLLFCVGVLVVACLAQEAIRDTALIVYVLDFMLLVTVVTVLIVFNAVRKNKLLLNEYKIAVDVSNIVSRANAKGYITYVNDEFCHISGYTREELIGKSHNMVRHPNMPSGVFKEMWETIQSKKIWKGVVENRRKDGQSYFVDATIVPILDINGNIIEFLGIRHNITEFIKNKQKLYTNSLTGLPNRYKLSFDIQNSNGGALAVINIDQFKVINDFYGNDAGDFILKEFADRLRKVFAQKNLFVYKMSADEYCLFDTDFDEAFVDKIVSGIYLACKDSITSGEIDIVISVTMGISFGRENTLEHASMALNFAKKHKKHYSVYNDSMLIDKNYEQNLNIGKAIRDAIENDYFEPYFQPIVDIKTQKITKYEALVRLVKPNGEVLSPYSFLEVAKAIRLYPFVTRAMVTKAFEKFKNKTESFSINLSVEDILDAETRYFIFAMLDSYGIADRVIFEILESEGIENYSEVSRFFTEVKKRGVAIAIDDFGTGYSNFEYLTKLNIDIIKIDGSLIKNITTDENAKIITETIVGFAKKLGIQTVAEFVHSKEVYDTISEIGVDYAQGYYLGQPNAI